MGLLVGFGCVDNRWSGLLFLLFLLLLHLRLCLLAMEFPHKHLVRP